MGTNTTRRALLGSALLAPIATAAVALPTTRATAPDTAWTRVIAEYRATHAAWLVALAEEDDRTDTFHEAQDTLPPKPQQPPSGLPDDIEDMTIRQIKASGAGKEAWASYESDLAAWKQQSDALEQEIVGPATTRERAAYEVYSAAAGAFRSFRPRTFTELREKVEIISADYDGTDIPDDCFAEIVADLRHLTGEARS